MLSYKFFQENEGAFILVENKGPSFPLKMVVSYGIRGIIVPSMEKETFILSCLKDVQVAARILYT